jgi:hypothetical protein
MYDSEPWRCGMERAGEPAFDEPDLIVKQAITIEVPLHGFQATGHTLHSRPLRITAGECATTRKGALRRVRHAAYELTTV